MVFGDNIVFLLALSLSYIIPPFIISFCLVVLLSLYVVLFVYCDIMYNVCMLDEMPCMSRSYLTAFTFLPFWATVCLLYLHSVRAQFCWEGKINLPKFLI